MEADPVLYPFSNIAVDGDGTDVTKVSPAIAADGEETSEDNSSFSPEKLAAMKSYRIQPSTLATLAEILDKFNGTNNFWNFTPGKKFDERNAERFIKSFKIVGDPFICKEDGETEWITLRVHGQSFMLHQIRKMVGLAVMAIRTKTPTSIVPETFKDVRINVPKAPGFGLLLERAMYTAYDFSRPLSIGTMKDLGKPGASVIQLISEIMSQSLYVIWLLTYFKKAFKEQWIWKKMIEQELKDPEVAGWLRTVDLHSIELSWWLTKDGKIDAGKKPMVLEREF
jgi:tRNA pseudouridine38-40 synthase